MDYRFTHIDGRTGTGWSAWAAIVAAIGAAEANALPQLPFEDIHWQHDVNGIKLGDVILKATSEKFGRMVLVLNDCCLS